MAAEVSAADGAIKRGADVVARTRGELQSELSALEGKLAGIGSHWQGQGAVAFNQLMVRWRDDASKIVAALNEFEANLVQSQSSYTASDDTQSSTFSRLSGRLG